jgi:hypothetical protein
MNRSGMKDGRALATRFALGPAAIVAVFFFLQRNQFAEVWKPLLFYYAVAIPGFFLVDKLKKSLAQDAPGPEDSQKGSGA